MAIRERLILAVALLQALAHAKKCSKINESCLTTGCCSTPKTKCFKKNDEAAFCRLECKPGVHADDPKQWRTPWSCTILTFGCNPAFKQCEGGQDQNPDITPCCQTGCICNYTSKYFHQCINPKDETAPCSKDGPETIPDFARKAIDKAKGKSAGSSRSKESKGGASKEDEDDDGSTDDDSKKEVNDAAAANLNCFKTPAGWAGPDCGKKAEEKVEILSDSATAYFGQAPVHFGVQCLGYVSGASVLAAAAGMFVLRRRRWNTYALDAVPDDDDDESSS